MAARFMAAGFVHGVLNSDNINVTGESFDYGPWRFAPFWESGFTAAYFDHAGLYAFGRQPEAGFWNLQQLAACLVLVSPDQAGLIAALNRFSDAYKDGLREAMIARAREAGVDNVWQLEGGILKYFELAGGAHYRGDCFVFDEREAVDPTLAPTGTQRAAP